MLNLEKYLSIGQNAVVVKEIQREDTVDNYPNELKDLLATPRMIHWVLDASIEAVDPFLPLEYASVGTGINFSHTAPTYVGMTVTIKATIIAIADKEIILDIKAWDERSEIAKGTVYRSIVQKEVLLQKAKERTRFMRNPSRASYLLTKKYK